MPQANVLLDQNWALACSCCSYKSLPKQSYTSDLTDGDWGLEVQKKISLLLCFEPYHVI